MKNRLDPRLFYVMEQAVERGIEIGWNRAHKHTDEPGESDLKERLAEGVMEAIDEYFDLEGGK